MEYGPDRNGGMELRSPDDLPSVLRPREKLFRSGPGALSRGELLAVLLGSGNGKESAHRIAERLLRRHGLDNLSRLPPADLGASPGIGQAYAARLAAAFELGRRVSGETVADNRPRINRPEKAYRQVRRLAAAKKEHLVGLYLDAQNGLVHQETISIGTLNTTRTHPREILLPAVVHLALGFILVHNHPSGCLDPSPEDIEFTRAVQRASEMMGIELYDHLIVAKGGYTSLRERGVL
ncbi:MAG: DNA repair protein RadC [Acidobacteria bacterium]|uniref:DNA repair protein RadC n=1 Tax=Candidatus Polarisedimenticola svalbardensis TaxID=2886004 RepID=A0A8J6XX05_9BACT|nr:DNA repair protein RadC [Candidatus Polarisedimenticola svalbardensis]